MDSCRDITLFKRVMTDNIYWFIGWQFDKFRIDKETVKSSTVVRGADYPSGAVIRHEFIRVVGVVVLVRRVVVRAGKKPSSSGIVHPDTIIIHREMAKYS